MAMAGSYSSMQWAGHQSITVLTESSPSREQNFFQSLCWQFLAFRDGLNIMYSLMKVQDAKGTASLGRAQSLCFIQQEC